MHKNALDNEEPHHLYEIFDKQEKEVFKYGISCDPLGKDGFSYRIRRQLKLLNLAAGWIRYFARIILENIPGCRKAEEIEDEYMNAFEKEKGRLPRGNLRKNRNN